MSRWKDCGVAFVVGDVVRWKEAVWKPKRSARAKPVRIGERAIVAQVTHCEGNGWVTLAVKSSEAKLADTWWKELPKLDVEVRRRRQTLARGGAERMAWNDESARALVTSRFFKASSAVEVVSEPKPGGSRRR